MTAEQAIKLAERKARKAEVLARIAAWLEAADEYVLREEPTTRVCTGHIGNSFSNLEPDGGLVITIQCTGFPKCKQPVCRMIDRERWTVSAPF